MADEPRSLESSPTNEPRLGEIINELEQGQADMSAYVGRMGQAKLWWQCEWDNQFLDGRVHPIAGGPDCWPWPGASDSRLRIVQTIVQEHVTLDLVAFWTAKVQIKSVRPFVQGTERNIAQRMLEWRIYTQMKRELLSELELAYNWKHYGGLAFLGITWEQQREINYVPISLQDIAAVGQKLGLSGLMEMINDPDKAYDKQLIDVLQSFSQILDATRARQILNELRNSGQSLLPLIGLRVNKPKWTALRPGVDVIFPSETSDIQQSRYTGTRELVSEPELIDRVATDGYDPDFVDAALDHKGVFSSLFPLSQTTQGDAALGSDRSLIELIHFIAPYIDNGVPCKYRTVFNYSTLKSRNGRDDLYALHRKFEYDHQQYPLVSLRRTNHFRPLLTSIGIAEEAYTDELDIKRQQDGINNRTDIVIKPAMTVPTLRAQAIKNQYGPGAVMPALRPTDVQWAPLPPFDETPVLVMQMVQQRLDRRYPIIGSAVDPEIKAVHRQRLAMKNLGEMELALEQTYQLEQQFETDEDVQRVAGGKEPWNFSTKDIQGQYELSATVDMKAIDLDYAEVKLDMMAKLMPFKDAGGVVFKAAAQQIDPDLADEIVADQMSPAAQERERQDEYNAVSQILSGMEPTKPMMANNQFRLQIIQQIVSDPGTMQKVSGDQIAQKRLENRMKFFQSQIQQFNINPTIGRTLAVNTLQPNAMPQVSYQSPQ